MTAPAHMGAYIHTARALLERYDLSLSLREYEDLCLVLRDQRFHDPGHPCLLRVLEGTRLFIRWRVRGTPVKFVYCTRAGLIITAYPFWRADKRSTGDGAFINQQRRHQRAYRRKDKHRREWE